MQRSFCRWGDSGWQLVVNVLLLVLLSPVLIVCAVMAVVWTEVYLYRTRHSWCLAMADREQSHCR